DDVRSPYPFGLILPQSDTERLLEERLAGQGVSVERNVEMLSFTRRDDGVNALLRHADGREEAVAAGWLVGCDGAHSAVRRQLGATFSGETLDSDWMLADVHMQGYPRPDSEATIYWHRDGVFIVFPISPGRYRLLADLPSSGAAQAPTPTLQQVQALADRRGPSGLVVSDPLWLSGFRINGRKVSEYRWGRVFLAGDAAHIHSPAGGQGMNTGMQDAMNLAWKLALVGHGTCADGLLDSYSRERSQVGDQVLEAAARLTAIGTLKNPLAQGLRNLVGHTMLGFSAVQNAVADKMTEVTIGYPDSPLNGPGLSVGPKPGERVEPVAGEPAVGAGNRPLFALFAAAGPDTADLLRQFDDLLDPRVRAPFRADGIWLVRPDGYVAMAAAADDWRKVAAYLDRLRAAPTPAAATGPDDGETIEMGSLRLRFLRTKDQTKGSLDVFEMTVQPNGRMPVPHYHETWDETIYGLAGTTTWRIDGRDMTVGPGQTVFIPRGTVHGFRNETGAPASFLCVLTPGVLGPDYFREIAALLAGGAPDPAAMKQVMLRHGLVPCEGG
ncbi:MAG: FAD-dependent monooxygenase, partial [Rhodospirillales bacterium]|nr:FAD-dependent monooxygenase [Rhodospirillales bacterium]